MRTSFDIVLENPILLPSNPLKTIGQILFETLPCRDEKSNIILSHIDNDYVEISLLRLRQIVLELNRNFRDKGIMRGQTVVLLTFHGCNEMFTALYFAALASMGCRVFMPMYSETNEFSSWIDITQASHIILPEGEVLSLDGHEKEKSAVKEIRNIAEEKGVGIWDNLNDFTLLELLKMQETGIECHDPLQPQEIVSTAPEDEVLIVTTSGTSGRSRLVVYTHKAYYLCCLSWEQAGFYKPELLGGTGFTPLFTHTMGIRAFINALWTGVPVCLIITDWFFEKPEVVRYLLLKMKPAHITGGPAVYNAFIELFRTFPELKSGLSRNLKTVVSSGAAYNPVTAKEILNATGLLLHNAFGTTETQQVLSTLLSSPSVFQENLIPLGNLLPGVIVGLIRNGKDSVSYRLYIKSVFSHKRCISEEDTDNEEFYDTGDIVVLKDTDNLFYAGRASQDYLKDNFGVKIPVRSLQEYYHELIREVIHAEFFPMINFPAISALLFVCEKGAGDGQVTDRNILKKYAGIIEGINNRLINKLETFEFQHRHICRIAIFNQSPPLTGKGSVSVKEIAIAFRDIIERLTDTRKDSAGIEITERSYKITDKYTRFVGPQTGALMTALKINVSYHRGEKDTLFSYIRGKETEVLDLVGGYGTNFTGHNHPAICKALTEFVSGGGLAISNQASIQQTTGLLAEKLNLMIGSSTGRSYQVVFASSGSEAVEIALQHAYFEWKNRIEKLRDQQIQIYGAEKVLNAAEIWNANMRLVEDACIKVIGLSQAFHGHSTGARSLQGNDRKRKIFRQLSHIEPLFLDDRDVSWHDRLDKLLNESVISIQKIAGSKDHLEVIPYNVRTIVAAIIEPVLGEGGVREVDREFLNQLSSYEFPLISDEIQCGLGRTGNLPENRKAHYFLFGKALGGGLERISAVLIDSTRYCYKFNENYVSTFGNGELAASVALATLQLIEKERLDLFSAKTGSLLYDRLSGIRDKYPSVIADVRGKGLMQAIYFNPGCGVKSILLRILFETEKAGYLFAAWFLNRHHIRILTSLSAPHTLRVEPSAYFTVSEIERICIALDELCRIIKDGRMYDLFSFLMDDDHFIEKKETTSNIDHYDPVLELPSENAFKVAFIAHFVFPVRELRMLEPDLEKASDTGLRIFFKKMQILLEMKPIQIIATNLFNNKVHFSFYALPLDSAELEYMHKSGRRRNVVSKIQEAVDKASSEGARVISLGGYTSILTNNGLSLAEPAGTRIITGNTLTAASGLIHLGKIIRQRPEFNKPNTIAVVGSTGNIGRILSYLLYHQEDICGTLILISRFEKRDLDLMNDLMKGESQQVNVRSSVNLSETRNADIIVICTNTNDPIIFPYHIARDKPVLISDLSVPSAVSDDVGRMPGVTVLPFSAYVNLCEDRGKVISSYSPPGTVFCCAGEAILLALEPCAEPLKGKIMPGAVEAITRLASKYGFFHNIETMKSFKATNI